MFAAFDGSAIGLIAVADVVKPQSAAAIARLHAMGIETAMITGDSLPTAEAIASVMGKTLLLAWAGETFMLSAEPIWVQPIAVALMAATANGLVDLGRRA